MLNIMALDTAAAAASTELFFGIFCGRATVVIELEDAPLVLRDGGYEFGAEYPVGTIISLIVVPVIIGKQPADVVVVA